MALCNNQNIAMDSSVVTRTLDSIQFESFTSDAERYEATEAARRLVARLETPFERVFSLTLTNPVLFSGLQVFRNLGIWKNWTQQCETSGNTPQRLDSILAMAAQAVEPNLLRE